jgi:hypothetical protein
MKERFRGQAEYSAVNISAAELSRRNQATTILTPDHAVIRSGKPCLSLYKWTETTFSRGSVAWSPHLNGFAENFCQLGDDGTSVIRGGFDVLNDAYGEQIAVTFDLNNSLGSLRIPRLPPTPSIRLPAGAAVHAMTRTCERCRNYFTGTLTFPQQKPLDFRAVSNLRLMKISEHP